MFQPSVPFDSLSAKIRVAEDEVFRHDRAAKQYQQTTNPVPSSLSRGQKKLHEGLQPNEQPVQITGDLVFSDPHTTVEVSLKQMTYFSVLT